MMLFEVEVWWDFQKEGVIKMDVFTEDAKRCTSELQTHNIDVV